MSPRPSEYTSEMLQLVLARGQHLDQLQPTSAPLLTELMEPSHEYARLMERGLGMLQSVPVRTSAVTNVLK